MHDHVPRYTPETSKSCTDAAQRGILSSLCCAENLGFHNGRPLAALVIFRCCLQWRTFQADRTVLFDKARAWLLQNKPLVLPCTCCR